MANKFNRILKVSPYEVATIELIKPILLARSESTDKAPNTPLVASPDDGAPNQALHVDLSWTGSDPDGDMLYFDVYFGNSNPPADLVSRGQLTTVTDVGELAPSTPYYWKVVAWDEHGLSKAGPVWSFTTGYRVAGDMVTIPAGPFWMGCDSAHNGGFTCDDDALPLRQVTLDAYRIDVFEVSESLYKVCMDAGVCPWLIIQSMDNPIITTWNQAQTYCTWAGKRLPTEAEWEKAARGEQDTRAYPWGDQQPDCTLANIGAQLVIGGCSGFPWFFPVDSFPDGASPYGVINMAGNVMEWVSDWYQADYYTGSSAYNPPGPETGVNKVIRGGNINATDYFWFLVSHRWFESPGSYNGFRCAASVTP